MKYHLFSFIAASLLVACSSTGQREVAKTVKSGSSSAAIESFMSLSDPAASASVLDSRQGPAADVPSPREDTQAATSSSSTTVDSATPREDTQTVTPSLPTAADSTPSAEEDVTETTMLDDTDTDDDSETEEVESSGSEVASVLPRLASTLRNAIASSPVPFLRQSTEGPAELKPIATLSSNVGSSQATSTDDSESTDSSPPAATAVSSSQTSTPPRTTSEVLQAVGSLRGLAGWTIIPFAHFQREDRHVVVAWPAINSAGQLVDATVVGICLEETDTGLEECGRRWVVNDQSTSRAAVVEALGGSDYRTMTGQVGTPLDELGPRLSRLGTDFTQAVSSRNRNAARVAATAFVRMLPVDRVAFNNDLAQLLYLAANYNGRLEHERTVQNGETATLTFTVRRGIIPMRTITATARPVSGSSDRWVLVSYR